MFYGGGNQWEEIENVGKSGGKNIGRELSGREDMNLEVLCVIIQPL